ncbi:tetratricopeptide repeat protein [Nannocystaceae bacterium ST9]
MRRPTLFALSLALALALPACAGQDRRSPDERNDAANKHYEIALGSAQNGSFDDAKKQIDLALQDWPDHGNSHYLLGLILLNEGRTILDFIELETCLTDESADQQRERADTLHREAHAAFGRAAAAFGEREPGLGRAYNSMAVVSLYFHDHERAKEELQHALDAQFYNEKYSALANLGWAYYEQGDEVAAITELRQAVLMNPDYCVGRYRLAQVYLDAELTEQSLEEIERVIADDRCPIQDAHRIAGIAKMRLGFGADAGHSFESCLELAPRSCLAGACRQFLSLASTDRSLVQPQAADAPESVE